MFCGHSGAANRDYSFLDQLLDRSVTFIPCVSSVANVTDELPESLRHINAFPLADSDAIESLTNLILENLRLLRSERKLFISYRRVESQAIAIQLYEALDAAGYDVFLDLRSVPYAANFQGVLWHRMADSDVVLLLDTPGFVESVWGEAEFAQANSTSIQILDVLWPHSKPAHKSAFNKFMELKKHDFEGLRTIGKGARLTRRAVKRIVAEAESLRAKQRFADWLTDGFCDLHSCL